MAEQPRFSDDRQWWWNGTEWRPIAEYRGSQVPPPPPSAQTPSQAAAFQVATNREILRQSHFFRNMLLAVGCMFVIGVVALGSCVALLRQ